VVPQLHDRGVRSFLVLRLRVRQPSPSFQCLPLSLQSCIRNDALAFFGVLEIDPAGGAAGAKVIGGHPRSAKQTYMNFLNIFVRIFLVVSGFNAAHFLMFSKCFLYRPLSRASSSGIFFCTPVDHSRMQCSNCNENVRRQQTIMPEVNRIPEYISIQLKTAESG